MYWQEHMRLIQKTAKVVSLENQSQLQPMFRLRLSHWTLWHRLVQSIVMGEQQLLWYLQLVELRPTLEQEALVLVLEHTSIL